MFREVLRLGCVWPRDAEGRMGFTFLQTGDWHIGKPFGGLMVDGMPAVEIASNLRKARIDAVDRLAAVALAGGAGDVLVAGDVFDRPSLSDREIQALIGHLGRFDGLVWHVIPGNHDPAVNGGAWARAQRDGLPANLKLHLEARPVEIAEGCFLLPAPLTAKAMSHDPTAWMDAAATPAGALRIGLAHGSIQGFGSERQASITIAPDRPKRAGLDYLALGDWHGARQIGPRAWYAGTPEPDGFLDNAQGQALLVRLDGPGALPSVERREIGAFRWLARRIDVARTSDLAALEGEIEGLGLRARHTMLQVEAHGRVTIELDREIRARLSRLDSRVFHLSTRLDQMTLALGGDDADRLGAPVLRDIARELAATAQDGANPDSAAAARALRHLFELAEQVGTDGGETGRGA